MTDYPVLFLPGPTDVDQELRHVMAMPMLGHREPRFVAVVQEVCVALRSLFLTAQHAAFETCAATALMEAAVRNLVPPGGRSLHLVAGAFGERWFRIARLCGRNPEALTVPLGAVHDPADLEQHLRAAPPFAAVMITHNETSTGAIEPLEELAAAVQRAQPEALVCVDAVTSLAGAELRFDAWGLDLAFAGTQKCLALPPGLTAYAVSDRALRAAERVPERGFLLDLPRAVAETNDGKTIATPCVPLVYALHRQLARVAAETLDARWARHRAMRDRTLAWANARGFAPFVTDRAGRSPTVSCIDARGGDVEALAKSALVGGFRIDKGYGDLKGKAFRIGHMGDHTLALLERLLTALG